MKFVPLLLLGAFAATAAPARGQTPAPLPPVRPVDVGRDKTLYTVGYSHLDTEWRWTYPLVIREFIPNTMRQNFPLFEKYPDYVFNFTGSRRYEFMKEYYPADYARVKAYVAAGRWFPNGSSVDENDAIVPSFESFQRQFLYGNRFFDREFGLHSEEFMLPDCFGFPAGLPTILHHGGVRGFSTQKLTWGSAVGIPFSVGTWVGPDGSEIVAALNALNYSSALTEDLTQSKRWLDRINVTGNQSGAYVDYHYYGVGDRGGAPTEASVQWLEKGLAGDGPVRVVSARADQMFKDIPPEMAAKLPRFQGELWLTEHSPGAITSQAAMKRWNRKNELLANAAESASVSATWLGAFPYPHDALYRAWDLVLGSQMHDILPGTSLPKAYEYAWNDELLALNHFATITEQASGAVLSALDTRAQGVPVAVYNPLSIGREDPIEALVPFPGEVPAAVTAFGPDGNAVPTQVLAREGNALRVLFLAKVPSVGYAIYDLRPGAPTVPARSDLSVTEKGLENGRYRVALDANGDVASIFDKPANRELLVAPARLGFHTERPRQSPAWNMDWSDRQKPARGFVGGPAKIRVVENGPVRVALEVERTAEGSTFTEQIRLSAGSTAGDRVETRRDIVWRTLTASLKADYRFTVANPEAAYDAQAGVVRRPNNHPKAYEAPLHQWMDLTAVGGDYGVAVLNDSKYGSDKPADNSLRQTLLLTPGVRDSYQDQATQDHGRHEILTALVGHAGDWAAAGIPWQAARLNQPLRAFLPPAHAGPLGRTFSLVTLNSAQARIVAVKKAEDSDEVIVRVQEITGQPATGLQLRFPAAVLAAREVNGQEHPVGPANPTEGVLGFDLKGFGVRAFAIKLGPPPARVPAAVSQPVALAYDLDVVSPDEARTDGALDAEGRTFPAELFPAKLESGGVTYQLGATTAGAKNALVARGQEIALPSGNRFNRVSLLVAARNRDFAGELRIGSQTLPAQVPPWRGFIGQWDNRLWDRPIPELTYAGTHKTVGLVPGFVKPTPVAWFATHHHTPQDNAPYEFSYLFELGFDLPADASRLLLPNDENLLVFAVSVSSLPGAAPAAAPLADTLADHQPGGAPVLPQAGASFADTTAVRLVPRLYHAPGDLRYTLDGSEPTAGSPVYTAPFFLSRTATVRARQVLTDGTLGPVATGAITVEDRTPPALLNALSDTRPEELELEFSEPLDPAGAGRVDAYTILPAVPVRAARVSDDGRKVTLTLGEPLVSGTKYVVETRGLPDLVGNQLAGSRTEVFPLGIVYSVSALKLPDERFVTKVEGLPLQASAPWTVNLLVKPETEPENKTFIAGFGHPADNPEGGTGRYFAKFPEGIRFWVAGKGIWTRSPLEVGRWQMLTATYDGKKMTVYKDGHRIGEDEVELQDDPDNTVGLGLPDAWDKRRLFEGRLQAFTIRRSALTAAQVKQLAEETKPF